MQKKYNQTRLFFGTKDSVRYIAINLPNLNDTETEATTSHS